MEKCEHDLAVLLMRLFPKSVLAEKRNKIKWKSIIQTYNNNENKKAKTIDWNTH